jgi:hypothetical protein
MMKSTARNTAKAFVEQFNREHGLNGLGSTASNYNNVQVYQSKDFPGSLFVRENWLEMGDNGEPSSMLSWHKITPEGSVIGFRIGDMSPLFPSTLKVVKL